MSDSDFMNGPPSHSHDPEKEEGLNHPSQPGSMEPERSETSRPHAMNDDEVAFLTHMKQGESFYQQGILDQAISEFRKAGQIKDKEPGVYLNIGRAYDRKGSVENERAFNLLSMENFRKAIFLNPSFSAAHDGLITLGVRIGIIDELVAEYKKMSLKDPSNEVISGVLKKLQTISYMSIPQTRSQGTEKGCMTRLFLDMIFPLSSVIMMLGGFLIHRYVPKFPLYPVAFPLSIFGGICIFIYGIYRVVVYRKVRSKSQW